MPADPPSSFSLSRASTASPAPPTRAAALPSLPGQIARHEELRRRVLYLLAADQRPGRRPHAPSSSSLSLPVKAPAHPRAAMWWPSGRTGGRVRPRADGRHNGQEGGAARRWASLGGGGVETAAAVRTACPGASASVRASPTLLYPWSKRQDQPNPAWGVTPRQVATGGGGRNERVGWRRSSRPGAAAGGRWRDGRACSAEHGRPGHSMSPAVIGLLNLEQSGVVPREGINNGGAPTPEIWRRYKLSVNAVDIVEHKEENEQLLGQFMFSGDQDVTPTGHDAIFLIAITTGNTDYVPPAIRNVFGINLYYWFSSGVSHHSLLPQPEEILNVAEDIRTSTATPIRDSMETASSGVERMSAPRLKKKRRDRASTAPAKKQVNKKLFPPNRNVATSSKNQDPSGKTDQLSFRMQNKRGL